MRLVLTVFMLFACHVWCLYGADWAGDWVTDLGEMVLEQTGREVKGRFGARGTLEGEMEGDKLTLS